jgi:hypothetical protein
MSARCTPRHEEGSGRVPALASRRSGRRDASRRTLYRSCAETRSKRSKPAWTWSTIRTLVLAVRAAEGLMTQGCWLPLRRTPTTA